MATLTAKLIRPELRFKNFNYSWKEVPLSKLMNFKNGINASKEDYGKGYKFINVLDIIENNFILNEKIQGSVNISIEVFQKNIVEYGDILFQRSSETREEVGQSNVYLDREKPATFGGFVIRGKKISEYYPFFLHLALKTPMARKEITSKSGGSTRYNVGQSTLSEVKVFLPEIKEQQKIASFLLAVDKRIDLLEQKKAKLEEYKKGVMQKIFNREVRFKDENGNDFPEWEKKKLGDILNYEQPTKYLVDSTEYKDHFETPVLTAGKTFILGYSNETKGIFTNLPTIIFDDFTTAFKYVDFPFKAKSSAMKILIPKSKEINIKYVNEAMGRIKFPLAEHKRYWISEFQHMKIHYPHVDEQNKIETFLSSIDKKLSLVEKQIKSSNQFKKGLLQQMFV